MRRRRLWVDTLAVSPTSRRRLDETSNAADDPAIDVAQTLSSLGRMVVPQSPVRVETPRVREDQDASSDADDSNDEVENEFHDSIVRSISEAYDSFLRDLRVASSPVLLSPSGTPPPPSTPPPPAPVAFDDDEPASPLDGAGVVEEYEPVLLPQSSSRIVQLPTGGFSFAPDPTLQLVPPRRHRRPVLLRSSNTPIVRQHSGVVVSRVNDRLRRVRRQLFRSGMSPRASPGILTRRDLPHLHLRHYFSPPGSPHRPPPRPIPRVQLTEEMGVPETRCAICLENYAVGDWVTWLPCQSTNNGKDHVFHHTCISDWAAVCNGRRTCPECRGEW